MSSPGSKETEASANAKQPSASMSATSATENVSGSSAIAKALPLPIFKTFSADIKLEEGLNLVRSLGGGKYEIIPLKNIDHVNMTSIETGRMIKAVPERRNLLALSPKEWNDARYACGQAVRSADVNLFRFMKLPKELRDMVYDLTIVSTRPLELCRVVSYKTMSLMRTCKAINAETQKFFWRNNFQVSAPQLCRTLHTSKYFMENVQEVSYQWSGLALDPTAFMKLGRLPKLRVLNLQVYQRILTVNDINVRNFEYQKKQELFQKDPTITKFNQCNGFDKLVQIRGLTRATVRVVEKFTDRSYPTDQDIAAFEAFLMKVLTLPRNSPKPSRKATVKNGASEYRPFADPDY